MWENPGCFNLGFVPDWDGQKNRPRADAEPGTEIPSLIQSSLLKPWDSKHVAACFVICKVTSPSYLGVSATVRLRSTAPGIVGCFPTLLVTHSQACGDIYQSSNISYTQIHNKHLVRQTKDPVHSRMSYPIDQSGPARATSRWGRG